MSRLIALNISVGLSVMTRPTIPVVGCGGGGCTSGCCAVPAPPPQAASTNDEMTARMGILAREAIPETLIFGLLRLDVTCRDFPVRQALGYRYSEMVL